MSARTLTGAHILVYINGKLYGRCNKFAWSSATPHKAIYGIDLPEPQELAPTSTHLSGAMSIYRTVTDGGAQGAGIVPRYVDIPRGRYFSITLLDRSTDTVVFQAGYCVCQDESWDIPMRGLITGNLRFEGIDWNNES